MFKIIAIDDNPVVVESLKDIIPWSDLGFTLAGTFTDSKKALDYVEQNRIDVILTDISMEEPDGIELVKICEAKHPHIKFILLSAFRNFEYARDAIRYRNVLEYLTKPLDFRKLCTILSSLSENMTKENKNEFSSEVNLDRRLEFFSNLLCRYVSDSDEINKNLEALGIKADFGTSPCSIVTLHIENFESYIENVWKHSTLQLYYAISNSMPFETKNAYYSLANYAYGNIVWIIIHKSNENLPVIVNEFEDTITSNLSEFLRMELSINYHKTYSSIRELISSENLIQTELPNENKTIAKAVEYMKKNYHQDLSMKVVADYVFMSSSYFSTYFKKVTGERFIDMLTKIRITNAAKFLEQKNLRVNDVCEMVGYNHIGNFYEKFKKYYNMTPAEYKNKFMSDDE